MMRLLARAWEKNSPELKAAFRRDLPQFVLSARPCDPAPAIPVFCYHTMNARSFRQDLQFLAQNDYTTLDADQLCDHLEGIAPAPPRSVVLTIDDGLLDLYATAFPLLREFGMMAVAFIAPALHEHSSRRPSDDNRLCTWQELEEMHLSGLVDIQSHTFEHRVVSRWPQPSPIHSTIGSVPLQRGSPLPLIDDLAAARDLLEHRLHKRIAHLAFPQYEGTQEAVNLALACGYRSMWWGLIPGRRDNGIGAPLTHITRHSGDLLRRLPGRGRVSLAQVVRARYASRLEQLSHRSGRPARPATDRQPQTSVP